MKKGAWIWGVSVPAVLAVGGGLAYYRPIDISFAPESLEKRIDRMVAQGLPGSLEEVSPPLKNGQINAVPYLLLAHKRRTGEAKDALGLDSESFLKFLRKDEARMDLIYDASLADRCRPETAAQWFLEGGSKPLTILSEGSMLYVRKAKIEAKLGRLDDSIKDFHVARRLALLSVDVPCRTSIDECLAMESRLCRGIASAAAYNKSNSRYLTELTAVLGAKHPKPDPIKAIGADFWHSMAALNTVPPEMVPIGSSSAAFAKEGPLRLEHFGAELPTDRLRVRLGGAMVDWAETLLRVYKTPSTTPEAKALELQNRGVEYKNRELPGSSVAAAMRLMKMQQSYGETAAPEGVRATTQFYIEFLRDAIQPGVDGEDCFSPARWPKDPTTGLRVDYEYTGNGFQTVMTGLKVMGSDDVGLAPPFGFEDKRFRLTYPADTPDGYPTGTKAAPKGSRSTSEQ